MQIYLEENIKQHGDSLHLSDGFWNNEKTVYMCVCISSIIYLFHNNYVLLNLIMVKKYYTIYTLWKFIN